MDSAEDLEMLARQVPEHLILLRKVHKNEPQNTKRGQSFERMRDEKPEKFASLLDKAELSWRMAIAALDDPRRVGEAKLLTVSNLDDDDGLQRAVGACRQWLKGHNRDAGSDRGVGGASGDQAV